MVELERYVTFPLAGKQFALHSSQVQELLMPAPLYWFPHTMHSVLGVLMRRGKVVPVCDLGPAFGTPEEVSFYVVARVNYVGRVEEVALPVDGLCQLVQGESAPLSEPEPFVSGRLLTGNTSVPLLDLDRVVEHCIQPVAQAAREARR